MNHENLKLENIIKILDDFARRGKDSTALNYICNLPREYDSKRHRLILNYYDAKRIYHSQYKEKTPLIPYKWYLGC